MKKHHPHHHKRVKHTLTPEQKARRKARFLKALKIMLWLNPASAAVMAGMLIAEKEKERKARRTNAGQPNNSQVSAIVNQMQANVSSQAIAVPMQPTTDGSAPLMTIDDVAAQAAEYPTIDVNDPSGGSSVDAITAQNTFDTGGNNWGVQGLSYDQVFADAKNQANALSDPAAKKEALDAIADAQKTIQAQVIQAQTQAKAADPMDISQAQAELSKTDPKAIAKTVDTPKVEALPKPDATEKAAIVVPPAADLAPSATSTAATIKTASGISVDDKKEENGFPKWGYYAIGGSLLVAGIVGLYVFREKGKVK